MYIIDIEASGLSDESYPIEAAWCALDSDETFSCLINPDTAGDWDHWDDYAELAIHGISREACRDTGENVVSVGRRLEKLLAENVVFSDAPGQDQIWIDRLFDSIGKRSPASLVDIQQAVPLTKRPELSRRLSELSRPHRAMADCLLLRQLVQEIRSKTD
ncbi:hypothetical protein SAMN04487881_0032 [Marinobacter sp. es.048]|uniref:3'-5' exonuclease n=1 Tax=Marinobacter sp. es.048 TaxID=1761795 RepID=UPI000B58EF66|nr:hypothetical protein [Marinobacter sp. es.048]SNC59317.1 hypothetical protein SAMN04487881_0032 [Marinobacter sp. es.048]